MSIYIYIYIYIYKYIYIYIYIYFTHLNKNKMNCSINIVNISFFCARSVNSCLSPRKLNCIFICSV
jgi:hypothetical protein